MKAHRILVAFGMAVAAAVLGGNAQAAERPDDRAGMIGLGAAQVVGAPDAFERAVLRSVTTASPDAFERALLRETEIAVRPDDRVGVRGPGAVGPPDVVSGGHEESGFGWSGALLGAAGLLGALIAGTTATLAIRHRRRVILP